MHTAINKDINKDYLEAAIGYEKEIKNVDFSASLESYINLAFLYWSFAFLFRVPEDTPEDYSIIGGNRYERILELGLNKYPNSVELNFWKRYFPHIIYNEEFSVQECKQLIDKYGGKESLVPYFFLYLFDKNKYRVEKNKLLDECRKQPTAKNIYISSILESR